MSIRILFQSLVSPMVLKTGLMKWRIAAHNPLSLQRHCSIYVFYDEHNNLVEREFKVKFGYKRTVAIAKPTFLNSDD